jgi:hypothetical protein
MRASSPDAIMVDNDLTVRRERDGVVSVLASESFEGVSAGGYVRLSADAPLESASTSFAANIARGRAWQVVIRLLSNQPELAYRAAQRGVAESKVCSVDLRLAVIEHAKQRHAAGELADAVRLLSDLVDEELGSCHRKFRGSVL